jgi:hypothetical protein
MQAVGTNHKIEPPWVTAFERDIYTMLIWLKAHYLFVEFYFRDRFCFLQQ